MNKLRLFGWYETKFKEIPNWLRFNIGVISAVVGFLLLSRPFSSLKLLLVLTAVAVVVEGITRIRSQRKSDRTVGLLYICAAIVIVLWPGMTITGFALIIGAILIIDGTEGMASIFLKRTRETAYTLIKSIAFIILGYLAITWPDISSVVIAFIFGLRLLWFGLSMLVQVLRTEILVTPKKNPKKTIIFNRFIRISGVSLLLLLSFGLLYVSIQIQSKNSDIDSFYEISSEVPKEPGKIIKIEEFTKAVPENARGWRIVYTTTSINNTPAISSAFVMTSNKPKTDPQPVIAWTHGTTGYAQQCAPTNLPEPFPLDGVTPDLPAAIDAGYIVVGTDYMGLGTEGPHPYLIGEPVARASLDSIRAIKEIPELNPDNKNFVWGHSQGGGTALWTGQIAKDYAPEIDLQGIIAAAPASDVPSLLDRSKDNPVGKILGSFTITAYSNIYPDVSFNEYVRPTAQPIVKEMSKRCFSEAETLVSILTSLIINGPIYSQDPLSGSFGERLRENIPTKTIETPIFIAQGATDVLVFPDIQESYAAKRCSNGQKLEYKLYEGLDHVGVVEEGSPFRADALSWTNDRLAEKPFRDTCSNL
jgi:uncharacterized membrane protein HdeD (DUF308 family)/alpha-beta hydrolase superfamily lysophospholipase